MNLDYICFVTSMTASIAVNTLVTGMIVFRILKVTGARPRGNKFRHIMFIVIESGMALFAIQLLRIVMGFISVPVEQEPFFQAGNDLVIAINEMLNVIIIRSIHFYFFYFADSIYLTRESHQQ